MALSILQSKSIYWNESGTSHTFVPDSALTPGSYLVFLVRGVSGGVTISAISDSVNGSWGASIETLATSYIYDFPGNTSSGTPTVTATSSAGFERIAGVFLEVGGAGTVEDSAQSANVGTTDCRLGSLTTSVETMVIGMFYANAGAFTPDGGYTEINFTDVPTTDGVIYAVQAAGTFNPGGSYGGATNSDGVVVAVKGGATVDQSAFRFGVDDGNEASHTWAASENADLSATIAPKLLRIQLDATDDPSSTAYSLRYQKNGAGGYRLVPVGPGSSEVYIEASSNIATGGEATTARLTAPGAKSTSDFDTGERWDNLNGTDAIDIATDNYTELEWSLAIARSVAVGDYFDFRVYRGASALDSYGFTPRWTVTRTLRRPTRIVA